MNFAFFFQSTEDAFYGWLRNSNLNSNFGGRQSGIFRDDLQNEQFVFRQITIITIIAITITIKFNLQSEGNAIRINRFD